MCLALWRDAILAGSDAKHRCREFFESCHKATSNFSSRLISTRPGPCVAESVMTGGFGLGKRIIFEGFDPGSE